MESNRILQVVPVQAHYMTMKAKSISSGNNPYSRHHYANSGEFHACDYDFVEGCQHCSCFEFLPRGTFGKYSDLESVVENKILALISDKD